MRRHFLPQRMVYGAMRWWLSPEVLRRAKMHSGHELQRILPHCVYQLLCWWNYPLATDSEALLVGDTLRVP